MTINLIEQVSADLSWFIRKDPLGDAQSSAHFSSFDKCVLTSGML